MTLKQLLAAVGIGMAEIKVSLDQTVHPRGSEITGSVELVGGIASQRIERIVLELAGFEASRRNATLAPGLVLAANVITQPHVPLTFPFTLPIPDDADLSTEMSLMGQTRRSGCLVSARAYIPHALDPRANTSLNVTIHREIKAARAAIQYLGFTQYTPSLSLLWNKPQNPNLIVTHFRPPEPLRDQLEEATLSLNVTDGHVTGDLGLKPHETDLAERLKSLLTPKVLVFPLEFESADLLTTDGNPYPHGFVGPVEEILRETLVLSNNEKNRLLRASTSPETEALLRPASGPGVERPEELLRPAEEVGNG